MSYHKSNVITKEMIAFFSKRQVADEYSPVIDTLQRNIRCECCGVANHIMNFPARHDTLIDGLCVLCLDESNKKGDI